MSKHLREKQKYWRYSYIKELKVLAFAFPGTKSIGKFQIKYTNLLVGKTERRCL